MIAAALLTLALLAAQDRGPPPPDAISALSDAEWYGAVMTVQLVLPDTPATDLEPLVHQLESLFQDFLEHRYARLKYDDAPTRAMFRAAQVNALLLSEVEEGLLASHDREWWIEVARRLSLGTRSAELIAAAYGRACRALREAGRSAETAPLLDEARRHIDALAVMGPEDMAQVAAARCRLASQEAEVMRLLGRYDDARAAIEAALAAHDEAVASGRAQLAGLAGSGGDPATSWLELNRQALDILRAQIHGREFELSLDLGLREPALMALLEERAAAERSGDPRTLSAAHLRRVHLAFQSGDSLRAIALCDEARSARWYLQLAPDERVLFDWAEAKSRDQWEWESPDAPRVAARLLETIVGRRSLRDHEQLYALCLLARVRLRGGQLEEAARWLGDARAIEAGSPRGQDTLDYRLQVHWLTALEAEVAMARAARSEGAGGEADLTTARARLEQSTDEFYATWSDVEVRSGGIGWLHHGRRSSALGTLIDITRVTSPAEHSAGLALQPLLRSLAHGSLSRALTRGGVPAPAPHLDRIRTELLSRGGGMLLFHVGSERSHVFALDADGVQVAVGPPQHEIEAARDRLAGLLLAPPPIEERGVGQIESDLRAARLALGRMLVPEDLRRRLDGWDEVTLCGLSTVGEVPFETLTIDAGDEALSLGERFAVTYLASPTLGLQLLERERERPAPAEGAPQVLLVAAPAHEQEGSLAKGPLPWSGARREQVVGAWERVVVSTGSQATWASLRDGLAGDPPRIAHLIAHGVDDRSTETNRAILLSPTAEHDGVLRHHEIVGARGPELVVLSSCSAGRGRPRRGDDGIDDLGGAFLLSGSGTVVVSAAGIHFEATMELMGVLHERLAAGATPAAALRDARRALSVHERFSHPFFRDLVHVIGLGHRPLTP